MPHSPSSHVKLRNAYIFSFFLLKRPDPQTTKMTDHEKEIEDFGSNDDFWIFGYGYIKALPWTQLIDIDFLAQKFDMEATATFWYFYNLFPAKTSKLLTLTP